MRSKIQNSFHELPAGAHESLRDSLITHITQINDETDITIVTQLCLALADLVLLMSAWKNPIGELIEKLGPQPNCIWPLIVILGLIPEEINSRHLRLGANRRKEVYAHLENHSHTVCELLTACLANSCQMPPEQNNRQKLHVKIVYGFTAWLSVHAIAVRDIANNSIVAHCFQLLNDADTQLPLHEVAADCLCTLLQYMEEMSGPDADQTQFELEQRCFGGVMMLENAYHLAVAHEDLERANNICRVFTVLSESFLQRIVGGSTPNGGSHYALKSLDLVLNCVGHYDYELSEVTFNLWFRLSEELYQKNDDQLMVQFQPYVQRLIGALYRHVQIDTDHEGLIEEGDTFAEFRRKVAELIKDVVFIVGSSTCFKEMFKLLQGTNVAWEGTEAALFVMENVAKNIMPDESEVVPKVVEAILNLPESTHIAVRYTSIMIIGELSEWIGQHPESLEAVLNFLLHALQQRNGLAAAAASALTSICTMCREHMICHLAGLIQIAASLDSFEITNEQAIGLIKGIGMIVSRLPADQVRSAVQEIAAFQIGPLRALCDSAVPVTRNERSDPCFWLDRLAALMRHTSPDVLDDDAHPCMVVMNESWPIVSAVMQRHQNDVRIMERSCRCMRYAMRCIGRQAAPLLEPLVKQMVSLYELHHHSCFLYLGSILVDEFANVSEQCTQGLLSMLQAFIKPTFELLQLENGLKNHPDTVDDFFRLCCRYIQRCSVPFLQSPIVAPTMQCAMLACTLDHRDANLSVMKFFYNMLSLGRPRTAGAAPTAEDEVNAMLVKQLMITYAQQLVVNLLNASVFYLHTYMLSDVADVIVELKRLDQAAVNEHMRKALDDLPKRNSGGGVTATPAQVDEFYAQIGM